MTNEEILNKAIGKALRNGFVWANHIDCCGEHQIFTHDFAKAFFGEKIYGIPVYTGEKGKEVLYWQYHLQQMVLEPDPITYLAKFL